MISLVDRKRQWFKSAHGINVRETPRDISICTHAIMQPEILVVPDTLEDSRFKTSPLVLEGPRIRFYAGVPLILGDHPQGVGTLCLIDRKPRQLTKGQLQILRQLGDQILHLFRIRRELQSVQQEKAKLEALAENLGEVVWMRNPKTGVMVYVNRAFESVWEHDRQDLYNDPEIFLRQVVEEDQARVRHARKGETQGRYREKYRIKTASGQIKWIEDRAFPISNPSGSVNLVVGIAADVTHQMEMESLVESQRQRMILSEKFSSLGAMAGGIAHEINNPLSSIQIVSDLLLDQIKSGEMDREKLKINVERISNTSERIAKIVRSMRSLARDSTSDEFHSKDIWEILVDSLEFAKIPFKESKTTLEVGAPVHGLINCKPSEVGQVILNLVGNALDAVSQQSKSWVRVEVQELDQFFEVWVTDSGLGIPPEVLARMWDPFFTTKPVDKGNGLGLSISRALIERHFGTLTVDSSCPNTRFVIRLPKQV